jgi:hypothetical protein
VGRQDIGGRKGALGQGSPKHVATITLIYTLGHYLPKTRFTTFENIDEAYLVALPPWDDFMHIICTLNEYTWYVITCPLYILLVNMHGTLLHIVILHWENN